MKLIASTILLLTLTFSLLGHAKIMSSEVGNGGDIVVCDKPNKYNNYLLDLYEGQEIDGYSYDFASGDYLKRANEIADRLKPFRPKWQAALKYYISNFKTETRFLKNSSLVDVRDSSHMSLPKDCDLRQIAIQPHTPINSQFYFVDETLFLQLSEGQKAALVIHEVLYRFFDSQRIDNSTPIRKLTALLVSDAIFKMKSKDFLKFAKQNGLYHINGIENVNIEQGTEVFYEDGTLKGFLTSLLEPSFIHIGNSKVQVFPGSYLRLYRTGELEMVKLAKSFKYFLHGTPVSASKDPVSGWPNSFFFRNGQVSTIGVESPASISIGGQLFRFKGALSFYADGKVKAGELESPTKVDTPAGKIIAKKVTFYGDGSIRSLKLDDKVNVKVQKKFVWLFPGGTPYHNTDYDIVFDRNGKIVKGNLGKNSEVLIFDKRKIRVAGNFDIRPQLKQFTVKGLIVWDLPEGKVKINEFKTRRYTGSWVSLNTKPDMSYGYEIKFTGPLNKKYKFGSAIFSSGKIVRQKYNVVDRTWISAGTKNGSIELHGKKYEISFAVFNGDHLESFVLAKGQTLKIQGQGKGVYFTDGGSIYLHESTGQVSHFYLRNEMEFVDRKGKKRNFSANHYIYFDENGRAYTK